MSGLPFPEAGDAVERIAAPELTRSDLIQVFFRSFLFQSLWSFQRMQNVGWLFSLWPVFRRLYPDKSERARVAQDHAGYFNTHPYTADIILGVVTNLEERRARDGSVDREAVLAARTAMSGPLSALGETVFWATLGPLILIGAAVAGMASQRWGWQVTLALYLVLFNFVHVVVKAGGLAAGYRKGLGVVVFLNQWPIQRWAARAAWLGLGLCAGVLAAAGWKSRSLVGAVAAVATLLWLRRGWSPLLLPVLAAAAGLLALY